jgi:hypothetical protein
MKLHELSADEFYRVEYARYRNDHHWLRGGIGEVVLERWRWRGSVREVVLKRRRC